MNYDRRQHPRFIPDSALLVSLGQSKRGFLKDVSESGMAFDGFAPTTGNNVIYLAFDLPDGGGAIEAVAEVVWTCESLHRTGVRFLELAEASRRQLRDWISSRVFNLNENDSQQQDGSANNAPFVASPMPSASVSPSVQDQNLSQPVPEATAQVREPEEAHSGILAAGKMIRVPHVPVSVGILLVVLFVSTACVSLGYYLPGIVSGRGPISVTAPLAVSLASNSAGASIVAANQSAAARPLINEVVNEPVNAAVNAAVHAAVNVAINEPINKVAAVSAPPASGGFVLQVAAMARADHAAKLLDNLHRKNFPAFVPDRGGDRLYRVEVGPYEDVSYARTVAGDLKSAGFSAILRRRSSQPESN